jgi:hypothetical protein
MNIRLHAILMVCVILVTGCVRETTRKELTDLAIRYQMNTIPTVVYYIGSDKTDDYFYLDVPLARNETVKVNQSEGMVTSRFPLTRTREEWEIYRPYPFGSTTNGITNIPEGANIILTPVTNSESRGFSEYGGSPYSSPGAGSESGDH